MALGGRFDQVTLEEFDWVMAVNFRAVVRLTHAFLPVLKAHPGAHLVNVSSVFGIFAPAGQAAYSASKFAVRGFTEAVRHELAENGVGVTVVHPGGIRTRIAETARTGSGVSVEEYEQGREQFAKLLRMPPEEAAAQIVAAIEKRRPRLLIGWSAKMPDVLVRLMPGTYWQLIARRRGRPARSEARARAGTTSRHRHSPARDRGQAGGLQRGQLRLHPLLVLELVLPGAARGSTGRSARRRTGGRRAGRRCRPTTRSATGAGCPRLRLVHVGAVLGQVGQVLGAEDVSPRRPAGRCRTCRRRCRSAWTSGAARLVSSCTAVAWSTPSPCMICADRGRAGRLVERVGLQRGQGAGVDRRDRGQLRPPA